MGRTLCMTPDESDPLARVFDLDARRNAAGDLRDLQEEAGDENEVTDTFDLDQQEAREAGVALDPLEEVEPTLG